MPQGPDWKTRFEASSVTQSILDLCGFEVKNPNPYVQDRLPAVPSQLTPLQRETLLRLCDTFDTWEMVDGDLVLQFRAYGFPDPRKMRGFLMGTD